MGIRIIRKGYDAMDFKLDPDVRRIDMRETFNYFIKNYDDKRLVIGDSITFEVVA